MLILHAPHAPAAATPLIVVLGGFDHVWQIALFIAAAAMVAYEALIINRAIGIPYPPWSGVPRASAPHVMS
ncbi:MAG: hypothetical protein ACREQN_17450 [Candidatus Binataceae bacterium]